MSRFAPLFFAFGLSLATLSPAHAQTATLTYQSGGKPIRADWFHTSWPGTTHPAIVYIYGMDGMTLAPQSYVMIGQAFANQGYDFYILHYFDRTGTTFASSIAVALDYNTWVQTINDGIAWVSKQPTTNPNSIGMMSISLGSFLALTVAQKNLTIQAVAEFSGGLVNPNPTHLPPTLILHGAADTIVPVSLAEQLAQALANLNTPYELQIYPNEGHMG